MRTNTVLGILTRLKIQHVVVRDFVLDEAGRSLVLHVEPTTRTLYCADCGCRVRTGYDGRERTWRHTDLGEFVVQLRYRIERVNCPRCGPTTQMVPWAAHASWFTYDFEDLVAYFAQTTDRTRVATEMRIAWPTVGNVVRRVMERIGPTDRLAGLKRIGVDELSYRKHHEYVTVVVDHDTQRVVWAAEGKSAATLGKFFEELGTFRCAELTVVTVDMSPAFTSAIREHAPNAEIVYDRFHVQRLVHDALDAVRRTLVREIKGTPEAKDLKGTRFSLQRNEWNLMPADNEKLATVMATNAPLYRAYLLKATLVDALNGTLPSVARTFLMAWCAWAARSRLAPFVTAGKTIAAHIDGIIAYVRTGLSNGRVEGLNGKIRVITRRSFGLHSASSLISMIFLCCSGITLARRHA